MCLDELKRKGCKNTRVVELWSAEKRNKIWRIMLWLTWPPLKRNWRVRRTSILMMSDGIPALGSSSDSEESESSLSASFFLMPMSIVMEFLRALFTVVVCVGVVGGVAANCSFSSGVGLRTALAQLPSRRNHVSWNLTIKPECGKMLEETKSSDRIIVLTVTWIRHFPNFKLWEN